MKDSKYFIVFISLILVMTTSSMLFGQGWIDLNKVWGDIRVLGADAGDESGLAVACGDINGDGYLDIIIGAPYADPPGGANGGETYVIFGSSLPASTIDLSTQSADIIIYGADGNDYAGWSVACGNVNNDEYDDIIIGAYGADPPGGANAGETYVIFGSSSPPATIDLSTEADITVSGAAAADCSGYAVASGDVNGDGFHDIIIGALYADPGGRSCAGETYVIFGGSFPSPPYIVDLSTQSADITVLGAAADDVSGFAVTSGEVNGDGYMDIIIGAFVADPGGRTNAGETYVVFGEDFTPPVVIDLSDDPSPADIIV